MNEFIKNRIDFEAVMSKAEFDQGEINHHNIEKCRRLVMEAGLTKSSGHLREICSDNVDSHAQVLKMALEATAHYANVIELMGGCVARIYNVYQEFEHLDPMLLNNNEIEAIQEIIEINENT